MENQKEARHLSTRTLDQVLDEVVREKHAQEILFTANRRVQCAGVGGALGHPKVFYTIGDKGYAECMYCDRVFVFEPSRAGEGASHARHEDARNREETTPALTGDGLTERATPPPGETLAPADGSGAS